MTFLTHPLYVEWLRPVGLALVALYAFGFACGAAWLMLTWPSEPISKEILKASGAEHEVLQMLAMSTVHFAVGCAALRKLVPRRWN